MRADASRPAPLVLGLAGPTLKDEERRFFAAADPVGFILFKRNVGSPAQARALVAALRDTVGRAEACVLIDQEGGRVARLGPPHWRRPPPASTFGELAKTDLASAAEATRLNAELIAADLTAIGIDFDCAPVADLRRPRASDVVGDRAFSDDPRIVAALARAMANGLLAGGVTPIVKHIPGHGRAAVDSHAALPQVDASRAELAKTDFSPFRDLADLPWAMTAHVVYRAVDPYAPATLSAKAIAEIVRGEIGFAGVLISDDLSMGALSGSPAERARRALSAGCDLALHCNGDLEEMRQIAEAIPALTEAAAERLARSRPTARPPAAIADARLAASRLSELLRAA